MKKVTLLTLLLSTIWTYSQVKNYSFSSGSGTYSEITDGTLLGDTSNDSQYFVNPLDTTKGSGVSGDGLPIGFDFAYNGFTYDRFGVNVDGWIALGTSTLTPSIYAWVSNGTPAMNSTYAVSPEVLAARISALAANLQGQAGSSLSFKTTGDAPNRVLVVQWKNYRKFVATGDSFDFQLRLYETSNRVEFVYGTMTSNATTQTFGVGLRAEPATIVSNFTDRISTTGWDTTTAGTLATDGISMNNVLKPTFGLTYAWTPPSTCGAPKNLISSAVTDNNATLNWDYFTPQPSGYEYVVTTSTVLPADSGTAITAGTTSVANLTPNTVYNVYLRSSCGTEFSKWDLYGTFRTKCSAVTSFTENFDSYTVDGISFVVPYCWDKGGTGSTFINTGSGSPGSAPNSLYMNATGSAPTTTAYAILPKVSNLKAETNRLKFKAFATVGGAKLDIGYYTDSSNVNTFVLLQTINVPSGTAASAIEFAVTPKSVPDNVYYLGFRNAGIPSGYAAILIDDVIWETNPSCQDVKAVVANGVLSTSAIVKWTPGGSETAWQYVYGASTVTDPSTLSPVDVSASTQTINGLTATTSYNIWVRSKCVDGSYGGWVGPVMFTTTCTPVAEFTQNFDASISLPACWRKVGTTGFAIPKSTIGAPSGSNILNLIGSSISGKTVVAMQPVSNAGEGTHRLKFKFRSDNGSSVMEVGYLTDIDNADSFVLLQSCAATSTTLYDNITILPGSIPTFYLAFRVLDNSSSVFIDDVVWEPIPACPDVSALTLTTVMSDSVNLSWTTTGAENHWQYVVGNSSTSNPANLIAKDFDVAPNVNEATVSGTINGLTPSTAYTIWVRSKCSSTSFGVWTDPLTVSTTCAPVTEFTENFDSSTALPACWMKVGTGGHISVSAFNGPSTPNVLNIISDSANSRGLVVLLPVSNSTDGTHRLRFKFLGSVPNSVIEVGFLMNMSGASSFVPLQTFTATSTTEFTEVVADLGFEPVTQLLALRNSGAPSGTIYVDNVVWEASHDCPTVQGLKSNLVGSTSINLGWTAGGDETKWQYTLTPSTVTDPNTLSLSSIIDTNIKTVTIDGLTPSTSYKMWVRSNCSNGNYGNWADPISFTTTCTAVTEFAENFDGALTLPACWTKVGTGIVAVTALAGSSSPNVLGIGSFSAANSIVALQPVSNLGEETHRLRFKFRSSITDSRLEVGYLTDISDPNSFVLFEAFTQNSTTVYDEKISLITAPDRQVLAFRNATTLNSTIYIDDVIWEPIPNAILGRDVFNADNFVYYPNPVKDILNISLDQEISDVVVLNILGQQVISKSVNSNQAMVDMSGLSKGAYLVKITAGNQSKTIKAIKE